MIQSFWLIQEQSDILVKNSMGMKLRKTTLDSTIYPPRI
jgi:hypothetical protein